ncbi:hypothetical protein QOZ88_12825 [Blastococcus sp. BMG 814]|uniref:Uncharacterized protein n=1 Tax=Blastococcus carthaginiensis TaxID=3050034 RepID=A0ABT9IEB7_9ACTN|nr:hypothetical protein [Blastococcus carthaginiensis]MDP5183522.1 hypothetical protein [Blastococcus carthaginiensis]
METHLVPDLTHTLRRQPGAAALGAYREELRSPVDEELLATVVEWSAKAVQPDTSHPDEPPLTNT